MLSKYFLQEIEESHEILAEGVFDDQANLDAYIYEKNRYEYIILMTKNRFFKSAAMLFFFENGIPRVVQDAKLVNYVLMAGNANIMGFFGPSKKYLKEVVPVFVKTNGNPLQRSTARIEFEGPSEYLGIESGKELFIEAESSEVSKVAVSGLAGFFAHALSGNKLVAAIAFFATNFLMNTFSKGRATLS